MITYAKNNYFGHTNFQKVVQIGICLEVRKFINFAPYIVEISFLSINTYGGLL